MAKGCAQLSVSDSKLLFHLSLAWSSKNIGRRSSEDDDADFDDGFVFEIDPPSLLVDLDKLTIGDMIGEGSYYSIVYKGWYECHPVAVKVILPERTRDATPQCKAKFQLEVNLISRIQHKNIVKSLLSKVGEECPHSRFIGASVEPSMMIITELLEGGSLQKNSKSIYPMTLDLEVSLCFALDISQAMEYLHANGIIHRDLKPGSTKDKMRVKVGDFGIAREDICDEMTCEAGSYRYMVDELFSKDPLPKEAKKCYDHKADVYSFAIVLWSLIKNQIPFKERTDLMAAYATTNNLRPSVDEFPKHALPLLQSCWAEDPKLRPEFTEITQTLGVLLQNYCSTLASITEVEETDSNSEEESPKAQTTSLNSGEENISSKHDDKTKEPNDRKEEEESHSQSTAQTSFPDSTEGKKRKASSSVCLRVSAVALAFDLTCLLHASNEQGESVLKALF